jgi:hypothetical protein
LDAIAPRDGNGLRTPDLQSAFNVLIVKGHHVPGDGGGGEFYWEPDSQEADDGGTIISNGAAAGRWKRIIASKKSLPIAGSGGGPVFNVRWFGARGDGNTTDRGAIQAAINACAVGGGTVYFPPGSYVCDDSLGNGLQVKFSNISIVGAGTGASLLVKQHGSGDLFMIGDVREVRFTRFGVRPKAGPPEDPDNSGLMTSGACFDFSDGGIFNAIEDVHTLHMWDCIRTSHQTKTVHNLRIRDVTCERHKRFGAWLVGAIDPVISNLWTFHASVTQGACVVYDSRCDGLILTGAIALHGQFGVRTQSSVVGAAGPRALNASKCIMDNAGAACWSLGSLSYGHFDGCFAATQQREAIGVIIASDSADLHWTNARIANCWGVGVQINGAKSISFVGGSILGCSQTENRVHDAVSVGLTAKSINVKGMDIGQDPTGQLGGVPKSGVALHIGVRFFQIEGNNFIGCNPIDDNSGCPTTQFIKANNLSVPLP